MSSSQNKLEDDPKFIEWVNNSHKTRINKTRMRHPVMSQIRKYSDDKIIEIYKKIHSAHNNNSHIIPHNENSKNTDFNNFNNNTSKTTNFNNISVFDADEFKPSSIDKILYKLNNYYNNFSSKFSIYKNNIISGFHIGKKLYYNSMNKIDMEYDKIIFEEELKKDSISLNDKIKEKLDNSSNKNKFNYKSYFERIFNFMSTKLNNQPSDEIERKLLDREKFEKSIETKMIKNKMLNFWRNVLLVKPNYIIEIKDILQENKKNNKNENRSNLKVNNSKNYGTIFYKLLKIGSSKLNLNLESKFIKNNLFSKKAFIIVPIIFLYSNNTIFLFHIMFSGFALVRVSEHEILIMY